jgi:hypothetical protein
VITTQWFQAGSTGTIVAIGPEGRLTYFNDSRSTYFDVDPIEGTDSTVEVVAADHLTGEECQATTLCAHVVVEQHNISTGETEVVTDWIVGHGYRSNRPHDVDRIGEHRLAIADTGQNRVRVHNTATGVDEYTWNLQNKYQVGTGGEFPDDWGHINDVERISGGRWIISPRNMDQVLFLNESGLIDSWTLGTVNNHSIIYEQHNPDYIPADRGGPAVLIADSQNNRIVEYQRVDGSWERSWTWTDEQTSWPRDADRLPNGNTLITDTNGDRIVEVDREGGVIWSMEINRPYESERLGTGDESTGGQSAEALALAPKQIEAEEDRSGSPIESVKNDVLGLVPRRLVAGLEFILPPWMDAYRFGTAIITGITLFVWGGIELRWLAQRSGIENPLR